MAKGYAMRAKTIFMAGILVIAMLISGCATDQNPPASPDQYRQTDDLRPPALPSENGVDSSAPPALPDPGQDENPDDFLAPPAQ